MQSFTLKLDEELIIQSRTFFNDKMTFHVVNISLLVQQCGWSITKFEISILNVASQNSNCAGLRYEILNCLVYYMQEFIPALASLTSIPIVIFGITRINIQKERNYILVGSYQTRLMYMNLNPISTKTCVGFAF